MRLISLVIIGFLLTGCMQNPVRESNIDLSGKQGVLVSASHQSLQTFLYFTKGVKISFSENNSVAVPWGKATFINLEEGKHEFSIWFDYLGKSGQYNGCLVVDSNQVTKIRYKTPLVVAQKGIVSVETPSQLTCKQI